MEEEKTQQAGTSGEVKDRVAFMSKEESRKPMRADVEALAVTLDDDLAETPGLILPNGDINWNCPCMGGMVASPCGYEFREAFSCFHYSKGEPKGAECYDKFEAMHECMSKYPTVYAKEFEEDGDEGDMERIMAEQDRYDAQKRAEAEAGAVPQASVATTGKK